MGWKKHDAKRDCPAIEVAAFHDLLGRYFGNIRYFGYVRRPKSFAVSAYVERLKSWYVPLGGPPTHFNLRTRIGKFEKISEPENVAIGLFDPATLKSGCAVQDFCARHDIPFAEKRIIRVNESLSDPAVRLLFAYRSKYRIADRDRDRQIVRRLSDLPGAKPRFHDVLLEKMIQVDRADLDWASEKLGADLSAETSFDGPDVIKSETDMRRIPASAIDWLASQTNTPASWMIGNEELIADTISQMGTGAPLDAPVSGTATRARQENEDLRGT